MATTAPDKADLTLTGYAPTLLVGPWISLQIPGAQYVNARSANQRQIPGGVYLNENTPQAPASPTTISPGAGALVLTGNAPSAAVTANHFPKPGAGALALTGYAPVVSTTQDRQSKQIPGWQYLVESGAYQRQIPGGPYVNETLEGDVSVGVGVAALTLTGYAPSLAVTAHIVVNPLTGALAITGQAPEILRTFNISPGVASLILAGYAPSVEVSGAVVAGAGPAAQVPAGSGSRTRRRYVVEVDGQEYVLDSLEDARALLLSKVAELQPKVRKRGRPRKVVVEVPSIVFDGVEVGDLRVGPFSLAQALQERKRVPLGDIRRAIQRMLDDDEDAVAVIL